MRDKLRKPDKSRGGHGFFPVDTIVDIEYGRTGFYIIEKTTGKKIDLEYNDKGIDLRCRFDEKGRLKGFK